MKYFRILHTTLLLVIILGVPLAALWPVAPPNDGFLHSVMRGFAAFIGLSTLFLINLLMARRWHKRHKKPTAQPQPPASKPQ